MISPEIWKTIAECFGDILAALEKNERIGEDAKVGQPDIENHGSANCDID
ncbi:hypothetical protein [Enterococcus gilvus]